MLGVLKASPRAKANADAVAKLNKLGTTTGKINVPTIYMVGVADPITPAGATQRMVNEYAAQYEAAVEAAKKVAYDGGAYKPVKSKVLTLWSTTPKAWTKYDADGKPVAQKNTPGTGHCTFTTANYLTVAKFATAAADKGQIVWDGAARKAVRASKGLVVDTNYVPALLKFYN
jgi:Tfp pilus assembly major pilin PilA